MDIKDRIKTLEDIKQHLDAINILLDTLDLRNQYYRAEYGRQFIERELEKEKARFNSTQNTLPIVELIEKYGTGAGCGEYIRVEGSKVFLETHPWNFYGGESSHIIKSKEEITVVEAMDIIYKKKVESERIQKEKEISKSRIKEEPIIKESFVSKIKNIL